MCVCVCLRLCESLFACEYGVCFMCVRVYIELLSLESFQTRAVLPRSTSRRSWEGSLFHFPRCCEAARWWEGGECVGGGGSGGDRQTERVDFSP